MRRKRYKALKTKISRALEEGFHNYSLEVIANKAMPGKRSLEEKVEVRSDCFISSKIHTFSIWYHWVSLDCILVESVCNLFVSLLSGWLFCKAYDDVQARQRSHKKELWTRNMASASYLRSSDTNPSQNPSSAGEHSRLCRGIIFQFTCFLLLFYYWKRLNFIWLKCEIHSVPLMETNWFCYEDRCVL